MSKETTKKTASKAPVKEPKKNPLLDEEVDEETTDNTAEESEAEDVKDEAEAEEEVVAKPVSTSPKAPEKPKANVEKESLSDISATKKTLEAEDKVHFMIPLGEGEKPGSAHECFINGYKFSVPKGVMTQVPRSVAELLSEHYKVAMEAGQDNRVDLNAEKQEALG